MHLFIRGTQTHTFEVNGQETVQDIKLQLAEAEGVPLEDMALFGNGQPLEDSMILTQTLGDMTTLDMEVRMLGGKVHGSLARAGKVKGQTPKVDKQEKKKKKTGRAKRRLQYNRRFVNVVATFGKRKGPNCNTN